MNKQECPFLSDAGVEADSSTNGIEICLNCPYERCVYEVTTRSHRRIQIRRARVKALCAERKTVVAIAELLGVSKWTVENDIRANKNEYTGN